MNVQTNNKRIKETACNTYVRPQLEYCAPVLHPWQKTLNQGRRRLSKNGPVPECLEPLDTRIVSHTILRPAPACVNLLLGWPLSNFNDSSIYVFIRSHCSSFNIIIMFAFIYANNQNHFFIFIPPPPLALSFSCCPPIIISN